MDLLLKLQDMGFNAVECDSHSIVVSLNRHLSTMEVAQAVKDLGIKITLRQIGKDVLVGY